MDPATQANRVAWEAASHKYVREYGDLLAQAISGSSLVETERELFQRTRRTERKADDHKLIKLKARLVARIQQEQEPSLHARAS